jgi:hypothetical protein
MKEINPASLLAGIKIKLTKACCAGPFQRLKACSPDAMALPALQAPAAAGP